MTPKINALKKELKETRDASMAATRAGDFMKVARMTATAARINKEIMQAEGEQLAKQMGENPAYAARQG